MRLFGILAACLMATACGLSFNPDLPQGSDDADQTGGDGDIGLSPGDPDSEDPCSRVVGSGGHGGAGGAVGGESPQANDLTPSEDCGDDE